MSSRLISSLATTDALAAAFSDTAFVQAMLDFETALARATASVRLIPAAAAAAIARAAVVAEFDIDAIVRDARSNATPAIALVRMLDARVEAIDPKAASFVHFGATSQDVCDTALILCVRSAWALLERDHLRVVQALHRLATEHSATVMLGRTLLQPAVPITFGLKAAGWLGSITRSWELCITAHNNAMVLQFGGAAGTLAALGEQGGAVELALGAELGLAVPDAPWHSHRDRLAAFVAACGIYTGALGKMARDISLLMQHDVGEALEPGGGSSTMPHKRNPSGCAIALAAANRLPGLVASMLASMPQEHERSVGAWHAEAPIVADATQTTGSALSAMADVIEGLTIDTARMRRNIDDTRGVIFAERLTMKIAPAVGRARAAELVKHAIDSVGTSGSTFADVVAGTPELAGLLSADDIAGLSQPDTYLGAAGAFRQRLIARAAGARPSGKR
jgi:3-carboxy-cis,cis-muconate cycloisomerase